MTQKLGLEIVSGRHAPGTFLTGEVALAEEMQISRGAIRETLQILAAKGLIESRPRSGTRVLPRSRWNILDADVLRWAFMGQPDLELIRDIFELRATIEPAAAELAATRRTGEQLATMKRSLGAMRTGNTILQPGCVAIRDFHHAILCATTNGAMIALSPSICAAVTWTLEFKRKGTRLLRDPVPDHARVVDAIARRDPRKARTSMEILIALALEDMKTVLDG